MQIKSNLHPVGTVYSVYGSWGSGKSSLINLVREELFGLEEYNVSEFMCWWLEDKDKLRSEFLMHLIGQVEESKEVDLKEKFLKLGQRIMSHSIKGVASFVDHSLGLDGNLKGLVNETVKEENFESNEFLFNDLRNSLNDSSGRKNIIIIDDLDRLLPAQILTVFNMIKTIGRLPNYSYLIAYDRRIVEKLISKKFPSEGPHFLEKLVQVGFEIPIPSSDVIKVMLLQRLKDISTKFDCQNNPYFQKIIDKLVLPNVTTLRDLLRLVSLVQNSWKVIGDYANVTDFLAIETLKVFQPKLFSKLRSLKLNITNEGQNFIDNSDVAKLFKSSNLVKFKKNSIVKESIREGLLQLFPRIEKVLDDESSTKIFRVYDNEASVRVSTFFA